MSFSSSDPATFGRSDAEFTCSQLPKDPGKYRHHGKRMLDVVFVAAAAPIWVPLILFLATLILIPGNRPFFVQDRIGQGGRTFRMIKLRTMVEDADQKLDAYLAVNPAAAHEWAVTQKLRRDPRVTRIGSLLRKTSLDELPQLWNVLIGEMSLVGPRPILVPQSDIYPGASHTALRPGITGPWQISRRNDCSFVQRARYDAHYARNVSLSLDLRILLRTLTVVVRATGC